MPLIFLIVLLLAPLLDIILALRWLFESPAAAGLYLAAAAVLGVLMMKFAKIGVSEAMRLLRDKRTNFTTVIGFAKMWAIGALLFFPGFLSDGLALCLLLLPSPKIRKSAAPSAETPIEAQAEIVGESEDKNEDGNKDERHH